jgi:hypothetical protein
MAVEIRIEVVTDPGETTITIQHADEMTALREALGVLLASRGSRLVEALTVAREVLDVFDAAVKRAGGTDA